MRDLIFLRAAAFGLAALLSFQLAAAPAPPRVTGTAAAGSRVELLPVLPLREQQVEPPPAVSAVTDAAGRFALTAPGMGMWKVVVRTNGTTPLEFSPLPLAGPRELPPAVLTREEDGWRPVRPARRTEFPATRTLTGRILDAGSRRPVAEAMVWASADPGAFVRTDAEGRFSLPVPATRRLELESLAAGYLLRKVVLAGPQLARGATVALTRAAHVRGKVTDPQGRPLPGSTVIAVAEGALGARAFDPSDPVTDRAVTDTQGRFDLPHLRPEQTYEVRAARPGSFPAARRTPATDPARDITLVLAPARAARGKVQDPAGQPIADAEAVVRPALRSDGPGASRPGEDSDGLAVRSDAKGLFSIPESPAPEVELTVRKKGYAPVVLPALRIPAGTGPADLGTVVLRPGARLAGRVVDPRGQAVSGAEVFLLDQPAGPNEMDRVLKDRKPAATTAADGGFAVEDLPQGAPVHVVARASGYLPAQARAVRPPTARPLLVRLEPAALLRGRVVDEADNPVAGARIDVRWQAVLPENPKRLLGEPVFRAARSEADGRFEVRGIPAGNVKLGASALGFVALSGVDVQLPRPPGAEDLRLVLERGAALQGRVTTASGEPVPAVRVGVGGASASTDDAGQYWLEGADTGKQEVIFLHPSHGRLKKDFDVQPGVNVLDVAFDPGVEVTGRVIDDGGKPVAGARVELGSENAFELRQYRDVTGQDGRFRLAPVADGKYRLRAEAEGFTSTEKAETLAVAGEPLSNLEIALDRGATLSGRVLGLSPEDLARVEIEARSDEGDVVPAWTDGRGRYEVRSLAPGDWTVKAALWDDQRHAQARLAVRRSDRELTRDLEFQERLTLTAQVLFDEEPLPEARFSLRGQRVSAERVAMTDHEGRIRFEDLEPDTYRYGVTHSRQLLVHNDQVDLQQDREIVVRLQSATVSGLVSSAEGEPIANALLSMRPLAGPEYLITAATEADGRFFLERVQPGRYRIHVTAKGFAPADQEVQAAGGQAIDNLDFRLTRTEGARLQVRLASGQVPAFVHLQARDASGDTVLAETRRADAAGIVELSTLPAGAWTVVLRADGGALATASVQVPSPDLIAVTLPPAAKLAVRVPRLLDSPLIGTVRLLGPDQQPFWTIGPGGNVVQQWPLIGGKATVEGLPAGTWIVQVETPDGQRWQGIAATSGMAQAAVTIE